VKRLQTANERIAVAHIATARINGWCMTLHVQRPGTENFTEHILLFAVVIRKSTAPGGIS
jgi:hypothetical protein